jgi:hypothetical protein
MRRFCVHVEDQKAGGAARGGAKIAPGEKNFRGRCPANAVFAKKCAPFAPPARSADEYMKKRAVGAWMFFGNRIGAARVKAATR